MKKFICIGIVLGLFLAGCGRSGKETFAALADFKGMKIAHQKGTIFPGVIDLVIPDVEHKALSSLPEMSAFLSTDKVDAICLDMPVARHLIVQNADFTLFPELVAEDRYGFPVAKGSAFGARANEVLNTLKENGSIDEAEAVWFSANEAKKVLPKLNHKNDFDGSAGTIRFGCESILVPMSYLSRGKIVGLDPDIASRIAYEMNMKIEFVSMAFDELLSSVASGDIDMAGASISITEERKQSFDYVGPYLEGGVVFVLKKERLVS